MIKDSAEHEQYKQDVLKRAEEEAVAKFAALIPTFTNNIDAALDALACLQAARGLTPTEKNIMVGLIQLAGLRAALSCFNREALKPTNTKV